MENIELNILNEQIDFYYREKVKLHIDLKDGIFLNGFILKNIKQDIWKMKEDKLGEIFLFTKTIAKLYKYIDKEKK